MFETLSALEIRVLGCLIEKQFTTPDYYPMTLNSLVNACNQKTAREPVTEYSEAAVLQGLDALRKKKWVLRVDSAGARVAKFRHQVGAVVDLDKPQLAVFCLLLLRGPQTLGEIRARSERLYLFPDIQSVEASMHSLIRLEDPGPLVKELPREPGRKEKRYVQVVCPTEADAVHANDNEARSSSTPPLSRTFDKEAIALLHALKAESETLRNELNVLKVEFAELKSQFE